MEIVIQTQYVHDIFMVYYRQEKYQRSKTLHNYFKYFIFPRAMIPATKVYEYRRQWFEELRFALNRPIDVENHTFNPFVYRVLIIFYDNFHCYVKQNEVMLLCLLYFQL